jgi:hypothetical protein
LTAGETVVHVPMIGRGGGVGVIEIHGLHTEGMTNRKSFERPVGALKAMIKDKDFRWNIHLCLQTIINNNHR